jgi:serine phosphatase RsbU (regulator of sigma subunit)
LFYQEFSLRAVPPSQVLPRWPLFVAREGARLTRFLVALVPEPVPEADPPPPSTQTHGRPPFAVESFSRPFHEVGGDWFAVEHAGDGSLWVLVADATGHGRAAHLVAAALPFLWQLPATIQARRCNDLLALLQRLHEELCPVLPEGEHVEAVLARLAPPPDASVAVASAGDCGVLRRAAGAYGIRWERIRGSWLGMDLGVNLPRDQQTWASAEEDELVLTSDGVLDQALEGGAVRHWLPHQVVPGGQSLFAFLVGQLTRAIEQRRPEDDITLVGVRRVRRPAETSP